MRYRKLGSMDLVVSEIGFGAWGLGGDAYGPVDDKVSKEALRVAFDLGINFYDTSDLYGNGHSEEIIGKTLKDVREKIIIATKVGTLPHKGFNMPQDFSKKHIEESIEKSLKRLQTDYIDVYQLHSPSMDIIAKEKVIKTLNDLKKEGKIKTIGISVRSPDDGLVAINDYGFECIQVNFNLIDQRAIENGLFDLAKKGDIGIIARTPLCFGFLTGKFSENSKFSETDHRLNWPKEQLKRWSNAVKLFASMYKAKKITPAQFALNFCLSFDSVSTVIPGMLNREEVEENIKASELEPLTKEELMLINHIYRNNIFYDTSAKM